jgi:hypothetical protein
MKFSQILSPSLIRDLALEALQRGLYLHCILFSMNKQMRMLTSKNARLLCVMLERWRRTLTAPVAKVIFVAGLGGVLHFCYLSRHS